ncbi:MAG: four helix bundle protein [Salegentibacter sp.]
MRDDKDNLIVNKTFDFALETIYFTEKLRSLHKFEMSSQLFRSGTSIGANVWEAQNAESNADFVHKFKIAAKESDESNYWLRLCKASPHYPDPKPEMFKDLDAISRIMSKFISSSKNKKR